MSIHAGILGDGIRRDDDDAWMRRWDGEAVTGKSTVSDHESADRRVGQFIPTGQNSLSLKTLGISKFLRFPFIIRERRLSRGKNEGFKLGFISSSVSVSHAHEGWMRGSPPYY
jgi:hypothetical protein